MAFTVASSPGDQSGSELIAPGSAIPLGAYVRKLWNLRHYSFALGKARVESANAETSLGKMWLVGEPLLFIMVYGTIFGLILKADRGVDNFIGYLAAGQILFRHHSESMQHAGTSMRVFEGQIQTMAVPRALFPISAVVTSLFRFLPSLAVMFVILIVTGEVPSLSWLFIVPIIAGQLLLNVGVGMVFARAVAHLPDLSSVLTHLFRALLYGSAVVFPIRAFLEPRPRGEFYMQALSILNPLYDYIALARWALMGIEPAEPGIALVSVAIWSIVMPVIGLLWIRGAELRYGFGKIRNAP